MHAGIGHNQPARSVSEVKEVIRWNRAATAEAYPNDPYNWRVDRLYSDYMSLQPKWDRKVKHYLRELKARGERVIYADICGRTTATGWGVDASYCFALHTSKITRMRHPQEDVIVDGDLFRMRDFYSFLALMRDRGDRPAFVTFYPMAGLQRYTPSERNARLHPRVTWQRLENNLRRLIEVVRPGGYLYIDRPFQLADVDLGDWLRRPRVELKDYTSVRWMKAFCKGKRCSVEFDRDISGTKLLLRKWEDRAKTARP
jgi:hypothetical protein